MLRWFANAALILSVALLAPATAAKIEAATHPPLTTEGGIVAADHEAASAVGAQVLARGGNAVDAAAATALALGVVNPPSSGIGGGGFAVVYDAKSKKTYAFDFRETAPAALSPESFVLDGKLDVNLARKGGLAVGVPGEIAGLFMMVEKLGALPWRDVVMPSQRLAERGFEVGNFFAYASGRVFDSLAEGSSLRNFLAPSGTVITEGQRVKRSKLAATLKTVAESGADGFYRGEVADDIVASVTGSGGVMTRADLAKYKVIERKPLTGKWGKYTLATMPLPSSGGLILLEMLGIIDHSGVKLAALGAGSSSAIHVTTEVLKHAFADRARFLGDASASETLAAKFLEPARLKALAKKLGRRTKRHKTYGDSSFGKASAVKGDKGTSHLCVVDGAGNAVALTTTVNGYFGAKVVSEKTGIVLNNEIDDFSLRSGVANQFGLIQSDYNLVRAGKRPLSSMTPVIVFEGDRVVGCAGGSGGPRIISNTFQVLLNVFTFGMNVRQAVEAPRIHHQWSPDVLLLEQEISADVTTALGKRGHKTKVSLAPTAVQAIVVDDSGRRHGASDPRKAGAPSAAHPRR